MARRGWADLSDAYRARLERGGITRQSYESGVPLASARGHASTPERPGQGRNNPRFASYYNPATRHERLAHRVQSRVRSMFGDVHKFRRARDIDNPRPSDGSIPSDDMVEALLSLTDEQIEQAIRTKDYAGIAEILEGKGYSFSEDEIGNSLWIFYYH